MALRLIGDDHENGNIYHDDTDNISVFEDTQQRPTLRYYAWRGTWEDHDRAEQSPVYSTMAEAIAWVEQQP